MIFSNTLEETLKQTIRDIPDYPKPGIVFKDITPVLANPDLMRQVTDALCLQAAATQPDAVAAIEARGFIFGSLLAHHLQVPFIPVRKLGKLPYRTVRESYSLEYGTAEVEIHEDAIQPGMRVLMHDDLLATGGTANAAANLILRLQGKVAGFSFLINLGFLPGKSLLMRNYGICPTYLVNFNR
jgi:adenine phosphoribosyltransferase